MQVEEDKLVDDPIGEAIAAVVGKDKYGCMTMLKQPVPYLGGGAILYSDIERFVALMAFSSIVTNKHGGKIINLHMYQGCRNPLLLQLAPLKMSQGVRMPFGVQPPMVKPGEKPRDPNRWDAILSLTPEIERVMRMFDKRALEVGSKRPDDFATKEVDDEEADRVRPYYKSIVKRSKPSKADKAAGTTRNYPNQLKVKVNIAGEKAVEVLRQTAWNENGMPKCVKGTPDDLKKPCNVVPIVRVSGLYFMPAEWGWMLQLEKVVVLMAAGAQVVPKEQFADGCIVMEAEEPEPEQQPTSPGQSAIDSTSGDTVKRTTAPRNQQTRGRGAPQEEEEEEEGSNNASGDDDGGDDGRRASGDEVEDDYQGYTEDEMDAM